MESITRMMCRALRISAGGQCEQGQLLELERRMRQSFGALLRRGTAIVPEAGREYVGGVIRTVVTVDHLSENCTVNGVSISWFTGGVLISDEELDRLQNVRFTYHGGLGRAIKFIRHEADRGRLPAQYFRGEGFPYGADDLCFSKSLSGTVARVRHGALPSFLTNSLCLISGGRIEDLRLYGDQARLQADLRMVYDELVSCDVREWNRILRLTTPKPL